MRVKKVNRYWCDFCNKAGLSAGAMAKHEKHCTMNPDRSCRVCTLINGGYAVGKERMAELVALLPDSTAYNAPSQGAQCSKVCDSPFDCECLDRFEAGEDEHTKLTRAVAAALPKLREETENCPACILAALRQAKIPVPMVDDFDFKAEMRVVLDDYNESRRDEGYY
jgi:hypothetical protein